MSQSVPIAGLGERYFTSPVYSEHSEVKEESGGTGDVTVEVHVPKPWTGKSLEV